MGETTLLQNEKNRFLADEFFMLSWAAAVQRNQTFLEMETKNSRNRKEEFRNAIKTEIFKMLPFYAEMEVTHEKHETNIEKLITVSEEFSDILEDFSTGEQGEKETDGKLKAGTAQKLLNMMLKYCWCVGWINMPPDMPIDKHNLDKISKLAPDKKEFHKSWTKNLVKVSDYSELINTIKNVVDEPLSIWELIHWRRDADEENICR